MIVVKKKILMIKEFAEFHTWKPTQKEKEKEKQNDDEMTNMILKTNQATNVHKLVTVSI